MAATATGPPQQVRPPAQRDAGALSGLLFAVVMTGGIALTGLLVSGEIPRPDAPAAETQRFVLDNGGALSAQAFAQLVAAVLLALFTGSLAALVRRTESKPTGLADAASCGGILASALLTVSALLLGTLAVEQISDGTATVGALRQRNFFTGGAGHVVWLGVLVGSATLAAHRARLLPRWLTAAGFTSATLSSLSLLSIIIPAAVLFIPLGRFSAVLVIAAMSVLMATGRIGGPHPATSKGGPLVSALIGGFSVVVLAFVLTIFA